jgi:NAD(P)-dependent dehydrogenase (short-subunit alcohol dehydrogenase family)
MSESDLKLLNKELLKKYDFHGKTAIVTGGGSGLGFRFGKILAALGTYVTLLDVNEDSVRNAAESLNSTSKTQVRWHVADVTNPNSVKNSITASMLTQGGCDILVCCAGISGSSWIEDMTFDKWKRVIDVNLTGTFLCCQAVTRYMIDNGWGRIINIGSVASHYAPYPKEFNGAYNYSASKAGVVAFSRRLAVELAPHNITVNCISPFILTTPLTVKKAVDNKQVNQQLIDHIPMRRLGKVEDLDGLLMYLCSDLSEYLTGQEIFIDGGYTLW